MALEYQKKELTFQVNSFELPEMLSKYNAWADLIIKVLMYEKGTFPDIPDLGLGIHKAHYQDLTSFANRLKSDLEYQLTTYLPDIPVNGMDVYGTQTQNGQLLVIGIEFLNDDGTIVPLYLKGSKKENSRFFDFEINF